MGFDLSFGIGDIVTVLTVVTAYGRMVSKFNQTVNDVDRHEKELYQHPGGLVPRVGHLERKTAILSDRLERMKDA